MEQPKSSELVYRASGTINHTSRIQKQYTKEPSELVETSKPASEQGEPSEHSKPVEPVEL